MLDYFPFIFRSDPFKEERATGDVKEAHLSNFLHPVLYFYNRPVPELTENGDLARPDRLHHIVEDFLAMWLVLNYVLLLS